MEKIRPVLLASGLSSAMGQALCRRLAPSWRIIGLTHQDPAQLDARVEWIVIDLAQEASSWQDVLQARLHALQIQAIQGWVHMAGIVFSDLSVHTTVYEWQTTCNVNLAAAFFLGQIFFPYFTASASVVLMSSVDAWLQSSDGPAAAYGASKAGLIGLMRHWAAEWGTAGVRVNCLLPGALAAGNGPADEEAAARILPRIALNRLGKAEEVAAVTSFLLSAEASYVTGAAWAVDGGLNIAY
ncbi:MAG: SDR family oxidoreductase [Firmicutes bacterium]|nr:SDR family oxidoreductase [Bacillota bacterium]